MRHGSSAAVIAVIGAIVVAMLGKSPADARVAPEITLEPALVAPGDTVTFTGQSGVAEAGGCEVQLDGATIGAECSVNNGGIVDGSFQVAKSAKPATVEIVVCHPGCGGSGELFSAWTWSGSLEIGVVVPSVVGQTANEAEDFLKQYSLEGTPEPVPTDDGQTVDSQDPEAGALVPVGSSVILYLTLAEPELVQIPDLRGRTGDIAAVTLKAVGFVPIACETEGIVFRQDPTPGDRVPANSVVTLWCREQPPTSSTVTDPTSTDPTITEESPTSSVSSVASPTEVTESTETTVPSPTTPTTTAMTVDAGDRALLLFATPVDWRVIGLAVALIVGVTTGSFLSGRRTRGRRPTRRWTPDHLNVDAQARSTATRVTESDGHCIHVAGTSGERVHTLEER